MSLLTLLCAFLAAPDIAITTTPDQPLPIVYVDDPLIIEFEAAETVRVTAEIALLHNEEVAAAWKLGPMTLRAGNPRWESVSWQEASRGLYTVRVEVHAEEETLTTSERKIAWIDRPAGELGNFLSASSDKLEPELARVLQAGAIGAVEVKVGPESGAPGVQPVRQPGLTIAGAVPSALEPAFAEALVTTAAETVAKWHLLAGDPAETGPVALALHRATSRGPLAIGIDGAAACEALAPVAAAIPNLQWIITSDNGAPDPAPFHDALASQGIEGFSWSARLANVQTAPELVQSSLTAASRGATQILLPSEAFYTADGFADAFPMLSALNRFLANASYVGPLTQDDAVSVHVFRRENLWLLVGWQEEAGDWALDDAEAVVLEIFDSNGNARPVASWGEGEAVLPLQPAPTYYIGRNGAVLFEAARSRAQSQARDLLALPGFEEVTPDEMLTVIRNIASDESVKPQRRDFLLLLQLFPQWEEAWMEGELAGSRAAGYIGGVAHMLRALCILEQETGEPFLDPFPDRLARCREMQAAYVTGLSGDGAAHGRGAWLYSEVGRLVDEARKIALEGRSIEADAVAAIAEWRARALRHAAGITLDVEKTRNGNGDA